MPDELPLFEPDEPLLEMLEDITGMRPERGAPLRRALKGARVTRELVDLVGLEAYATLRWLSKRGHFQAAKYLVDRMLGAPARPFMEEVQQLDALSSARLLYKELRAAGHTPEEAQANVQRLSSRAISASGQSLRLADLED